ncbi:MAG: LacI family DNA-binding transcriptional regulator [Cytophagales bacterium]|nr:LacI family DNA-binding transcriptional regulator [Armatimonadota bacterium]
MVTMGDIAIKVGVSQATVSYVLGGRAARGKVSPETRQRIVKTARDMGYQRNQFARAMVTGKSRILTILTAPDHSENQSRILAGAHEAANQNDYLLKVQHISTSFMDEATVARLLEWRPAGALMLGLEEPLQDELYAKLNAWGIFLTTVDNARQYEHSLHVTSDNESGIWQAMDHLIALGHRRIAFLGGRPNILSLDREHSFRTRLVEAGLPVVESWIRQSSWSNFEVIAENAVAILESSVGRPTAVVCASDTAAMVVLRIARAHGLRLPADLSVTGFTNSTLSAVADPPLTTIEQPFHEMGYAAAMYLVQRAESPETAEPLLSPLLLPTRLIIRESTAPIS